MMFFLIFDISDDSKKSRWTDRKYAAAALPGEVFKVRVSLVNPFQ